MSDNMSLTQSRLAVMSYGVIIVLALASWLFCSFDNTKLEAELDAKQQTLDQLRGRTAGILSGASRNAPKGAAGPMTAPTETIAASELQKRLLDVAANCDVVVHSIQSQVNLDPNDEKLRRISSELTFDGTTEALQQFLFKVEVNVPFIFVDRLSVQPSNQDPANAEADTKLRVALTTSAYWKSEETDKRSQ
jgi:hypothetical protein